VADISPAFASAQVGIPTAFSGHFARPPEVKSPVSVSWTVSGPTGQTAALAGTDSTASLTPARSGVYQLALTFSYDDSALGHRTFSSDRKAYAIVPDANTETFEHNTITDAFPWTTSGDVPWTISHTTSQTGKRLRFARRARSGTNLDACHQGFLAHGQRARLLCSNGQRERVRCARFGRRQCQCELFQRTRRLERPEGQPQGG